MTKEKILKEFDRLAYPYIHSEIIGDKQAIEYIKTFLIHSLDQIRQETLEEVLKMLPEEANRTEISDKSIINLAKFIHETYENKARLYKWETQEKSRVDFDKLPPENAKTMLAVSKDILEVYFTQMPVDVWNSCLSQIKEKLLKLKGY